MTVVILGCIFAAALGTAWLLVKYAPRVRKELDLDSRSRQLTLDGLRGILALAVVCHHVLITQAYLATGIWQSTNSLEEQLGEASVALFFMITAFLFWTRVLASGSRMRWGAFLISRIFRLVPLYLVFVAGIAILALIRQHGFVESKVAFGRNLFEWTAFTIRSEPALNKLSDTWTMSAGVTWSLRYEWAFYLALPLLAAVFTKARHWAAALVSFGAIALLYRATRHYPLLLDRLSPFLGGIAAAYWLRSRSLRRFATAPLFGIASVIALCVVLGRLPTAYTLPATVLLTVFFVAVVCENPFLSLLTAGPMRWLGEVSYGVYLLHGVFLWCIAHYMLPMYANTHQISVTQLVGAALMVAIAVVLATSALNLSVERPGIAIGKLLTRPRPSPSVQPAVPNSSCANELTEPVP